MKSLFLKVLLPVSSIILMLFILTVLDPIKPQDASTFIFSHTDTCNDVHVEASETSCSSSSSSYGTTATLSIQNMQGNISHTVNWVWLSYFCPEAGFPNTDSAGKPSCLENKRIFSGTTTVDNGTHNNQPVSISNTPASFNMPQFAACGTYQNDFFITSIDGNSSCTFGTYSTNENAWVTDFAGACNTGNMCRAAPTATPTTPIEQPTATPIPTRVPTATPTPIGITTSSGCTNTTQVGVNNNSNCNTNNQIQNNNQTVTVALSGSTSGPTPTPGVQQTVLAASTIPQLPNTGTETNILFTLLALAPIGWKIRKLV